MKTQLPNYYEFFNTVKINSGEDALGTISYELVRRNAFRPLLITDKGIAQSGILKTVTDSFVGTDTNVSAIYDDTPIDSSIKAVNEIADLYRKKNCDSIIALGGGSVIDTAKGVNIIISEGTTDIAEFMGVNRLRKQQKPFIVIPTTSGTGSEVTQVAVISDPEKNIKMPFTSPLLLPSVAILDPRSTLTLPPKLTAATGMDALTHAIEAFSCLQKNPLSDAYALAAIKLISNNLLNVVKNGKDTNGRLALANASLMAGIAFSNSMVGAVHAISHACGGIAHVPHGVANSILLPYVMKFNLDFTRNTYSELLLSLAGEEVFVKTPTDERAKKSIETVLLLTHALNKACGLPLKLKDAGVNYDQLQKIAEAALVDGAMIVNPKELQFDDVYTILNSAF